MKHREVCRKDLWEYEAWSNHVRNTVSLADKKREVRLPDGHATLISHGADHRKDAPHFTVQYDFNLFLDISYPRPRIANSASTSMVSSSIMPFRMIPGAT